MNLEEQQFNKKIDERVKKLMPEYLESSAFTQRKLTDTPTDDLQVTPRGYVNMNGITSLRPQSSVVGQYYFDTSIGRPVYWNGTTFVDAAGSIS